MEIYFEYPLIFVIVAVIFSATIAFLLYFKDKVFGGFKSRKTWLMGSLRFIFVLIISLLILKPIIKDKTTLLQKPILVFLQDNSSSILLNKDSSFYNTSYKKNIQELINNLSTDYQVDFLQFDDKIKIDSGINYDGKTTDISTIFPELSSRYAGANLGAIILASDGIYNAGANPIYSRNLSTPIYSIALGDTSEQKDLIIKDIVSNKHALYKNKFPVRIFVSAEKCNEKEAEINITRNSKVVLTKKINLPQTNFISHVDIELPADILGMQKYTVSIEKFSNEISYDNNSKVFGINIIDNRSKILIYANAPHPDIGALKFAFKDNPDFDLDIKYAGEPRLNAADYQLIILHQIPSNINKASQIIATIKKEQIPTLFLLGSETSLPTLNNLDLGIEIIKKSDNMDDAVPHLNQNFVSFSLDIDNLFYEELSPLKTVFGDYRILNESKDFLYQEINSIKTKKPLVLFTETQSIRNGFILGEGIWKWRIDNFKYNSSHNEFVSMFNRIVQYLIVKKEKDKLVVDAKQMFNENESVYIDAEFYNDAFDLVSDLELNLSLINEAGDEFSYLFKNRGNAYRIDLGQLSAGLYSYTVKTRFDSKDYSVNGNFIVEEVNLEALTTKANHNLLAHLSTLTNGKLLYPNQINELEKIIPENENISTVAYEHEKLYSISDLYFLFFVILLFASIEWILRKYWGSY